jgi:hypothetical protein
MTGPAGSAKLLRALNGSAALGHLLGNDSLTRRVGQAGGPAGALDAALAAIRDELTHTIEAGRFGPDTADPLRRDRHRWPAPTPRTPSRGVPQ